MVLFININIGQEVEVYYQGGIEKGIVKYKGGLANIQGDWVGVALERPVGRHTGIYKGRQYFTCTDNCGIFVHPARIRFCALRRTYFNHYRSVSRESFVDESLFGSRGTLEKQTSVETDYFKSAQSGFKDLSASWHAGQKQKEPSSSHSLELSQSFNLSHPVGATYTPKKQSRPKSTQETKYGRVSPMTKYYDSPDAQFISRPTVPRTHDPLKFRSKKGTFLTAQKPLEWSI